MRPKCFWSFHTCYQTILWTIFFTINSLCSRWFMQSRFKSRFFQVKVFGKLKRNFPVFVKFGSSIRFIKVIKTFYWLEIDLQWGKVIFCVKYDLLQNWKFLFVWCPGYVCQLTVYLWSKCLKFVFFSFFWNGSCISKVDLNFSKSVLFWL